MSTIYWLIDIVLLIAGVAAAYFAIRSQAWVSESRRHTWERRIAICVFALVGIANLAKDGISVRDQEAKDRLAAKHQEEQSRRQTLELKNIVNNADPRAAALKALDARFQLDHLAVVKVIAYFPDERREKSGFVINRKGDVLTADFAVLSAGKQATRISVQQTEGRIAAAKVKIIFPALSIAVLGTDLGQPPCISLPQQPPEVHQQVLVIGSTSSQLEITRLVGTIADFGNPMGRYARDQNSAPGFGGGPVLDVFGYAIGLNWGIPRQPILNQADFVRGDLIRKYLEQQRFDLCS